MTNNRPLLCICHVITEASCCQYMSNYDTVDADGSPSYEICFGCL